MNLFRVSTLIGAGSLLTASAFANLIDFDVDQFGFGTVPNTLLNTNYPSEGISFNATARIYGPVTGTTTPPNGATGGLFDFSTPLVVTFDSTGSFIGASNMTNSDWTLTAYDISNNVLGSVSNNVAFAFQGIAAANIKYAVFTTDSQYAIDDLEFRPNERVRTPEPVTTALAASGIGLFIRRRRKAA